MDEILCPICKLHYNTTTKKPHLLFKCGHTLCEECIQKLQKESEDGKSLKFPEDNIISDGNFFPLNQSLLMIVKKAEEKLINKSLESSNFDKSIEGKHLDFEIQIENKENKNICSPIVKTPKTPDNYNSVNYTNLRSSLKKPNGNIEAHTINLHSTHTTIKYCPLHPTRPLEIICIEDKKKICTNCALFGEHKNHKVINDEDFIKEIEVSAEILIELFELIDNNLNQNRNCENENESNSLNELFKKSEEKKFLLISQVNKFIEELINNIKVKQLSILDKINKSFEQFNNKIKIAKEIPSDLITRSESWKMIVQSKLDKLNEITENSNINDEFVQLINTNITNQEIFKTADYLINEFENLKCISTEKYEHMIENCDLQIDYELANKLDSLIVYKDNKECSKKLKFNDEELTDDKKQTKGVLNSTNNNTILITNEGDFSAANNLITNLNHIDINNSFLNLSEDSAIKIGNSFLINTDKNVNSNFTISSNSPKIDSKKPIITNLNTIKISNTNSNMNNVKKDKSKSPLKIHPSHTPDKDKLVFIKNQFKNESANFTGVDLGEEHIKAIADLISNSAKSSNPNLNSFKVKELKLTKTNLTDDFLIIILKALENNNYVNNLNVAKNHLSDKSIDSFVNYLNKNKCIKTVYLSYNNFTPAGKEKLKSYTGGIKNIKIFI